MKVKELRKILETYDDNLNIELHIDDLHNYTNPHEAWATVEKIEINSDKCLEIYGRTY